VPYLDEVFIERTSGWLDLADGLLLGRRTYEAFARDWPQITDPSDPFTKRMKALPKYVVTNTLTQGSWEPVTILGGDALHAVSELKARPGGSCRFMGAHGLCDFARVPRRS
jgi:dihydrofolate reductase